MLRLYNSMGRKLQVFRPLKPGAVRMYTCGPTVWNYAHIGNLRTFVFEDVLRRYLEFKGYKVQQVMNITDVEDKIIKGIRESNKPLKELTRFYEEAFMGDLSLLKVERAEKYPRATEHIEEMVSLIQTLVRKGYAYAVSDGSVYFKVSRFPKYGALSGVRLGSLKTAGRVSQDHYEDKLQAADFALWKAWDPEDGEVFWETELGKGRPGWHIECSAMSMKYLGSTFDIHTGGMDNRFPHHENEIAQSEAATGRKFAKYWLHSEFLNVKGAEMHKSVGNVVYLRDLIADGWDPLSVRMFLVSSKYRDPVDLTNAALQQARAQRQRLQDFVSRLRSAKAVSADDEGLSADLLEGFEKAMDEDLNTPGALAAVFSFAKRVNKLVDAEGLGAREARSIMKALERINGVLGVLDFQQQALPPDLASLLKKRDEARIRRDFAESDRIRDELYAKGIAIEDTPRGTSWKRRERG